MRETITEWYKDLKKIYIDALIIFAIAHLTTIYPHLKDFQEAEANATSALEGVRKTGR